MHQQIVFHTRNLFTRMDCNTYLSVKPQLLKKIVDFSNRQEVEYQLVKLVSVYNYIKVRASNALITFDYYQFVFVGDITRALIGQLSPNCKALFDSGRLRACARTIGCVAALAFLSYFCVPYNKQLNNLDRSVVTGKSQTSAYRIDRARPQFEIFP